MNTKKKILAIIGSTRENSTNLRIVKAIVELSKEEFSIKILIKLHNYPISILTTIQQLLTRKIATFRKQIEQADGILICTPEYVFSLPGSLKNALEWTVSSIVFTNKPTALITASASGEKAHEELKLIMATLGAKFNLQTQVLIKGVRGKIEGTTIKDEETLEKLKELIKSFDELI